MFYIEAKISQISSFFFAFNIKENISKVWIIERYKSHLVSKVIW